MDKFDRERQKKILKELYECHPNSAGMVHGPDYNFEIEEYNDLISNLIYLEGHGLISSGVFATLEGFSWDNYQTQIQPKSIDFIRDDGGLSAILNVQTIRIHSEMLVAIEDIISAANIPEVQRKGLISKLRELPADAIKHLTLQLVSQGVASLPNAVQLIQKLLHSA